VVIAITILREYSRLAFVWCENPFSARSHTTLASCRGAFSELRLVMFENSWNRLVQG